MTLYLRLYWEFFKTGLFAIGGGMATLPFLKDIGATTGWFSQTDLMNMLAVSESTPGLMLQVITGITSASQEDSILMKFSWDGAISWRGIILALVLLVFTRYIKKTKDLHPIIFIGVSAVIGVVFHFAGV